MMAHLIFIEGVSGVGKTTTSTALAARLQGMGRPARCFLEGEPDNPLDLFYVAYLKPAQFDAMLRDHPDQAEGLREKSLVTPDCAFVRYRDSQNQALFLGELHRFLEAHEFSYQPTQPQPQAEFERIFLDRWARFAQREASYDGYLIFDGALFQHQINDLLRNYTAPTEQIARHIGALVRAVAPLHPMLFYLSTQDVEGRLSWARMRRGQTPPTAEKVAHTKTRKTLDLAIFETLSCEAHAFDVDDRDIADVIDEVTSYIASPKREEIN